ncbi:MAG: mechanosensitive ion channel family protein [Phycisphaerae bacterium]|nr:mechanosensitive ion channel family protein [Phycisphaerae bacterium]
MRRYAIWAVGLAGVMTWICGAQTPDVPATGGMASAQEAALRECLLGRWTTEVGRVTMTVTFDPNSRVRIQGQTPYEGRFQVRGGQLIFNHQGREESYQFDVTADTLSLSGSGLIGSVKWYRSLQFDDRSFWQESFSWRSLKIKGYRFVFILAVIVVCRVFLWLLGGLFHVLIYSNQGPLKYIYQYHKSRTMTIYSILLNASKYVVYVLGIGFVLNELGINYTTYLASLSVVGLAIGFGSQGLVQDMVTGFFIIFEDQFNVGDMVEISGNVGVVDELGLRMTRLRNFLGQRVAIPNRNITVVANYSRGRLEAHVDVAVAGEDAFTPMAETLKKVVNEMKRQFDQVILDLPKPAERVTLATGECFVRLVVPVWPGQQWVIEQQLLPRLREYCQDQGLQIPHDRVIVFYGSGKSRQVRSRKKDVKKRLPGLPQSKKGQSHESQA